MKILFIAILLFHFTPAKTQRNVVKINCPDSLGFITNEGVTKSCEFLFQNENPNIFFVENFSHIDFYNVVYKNDKRPISRVKVVFGNYIAKPHDFIFAYTKDNALLFYYILKDQQEEKILQP